MKTTELAQVEKPAIYQEENLVSKLYNIGPGVAEVVSRISPDGRSENEDAAAIIPLDGERAVLAVADGAGGHPAGHAASRTCLEILVNKLNGGPSDQVVRSSVLDAFEEANQVLLEQGVGSKSTLLVVEINGRKVRPYHVGDSYAFLFGNKGKVKLATLAHSPVGYAVEAGIMDEASALGHEEQSVVLNLVGDNDMRIEVGAEIEMAARDTLMLTSDGLTDVFTVDEIAEVVRKGRLDLATGSLNERGSERVLSHPDDLTFILFRSSS